ncbi:DNA replication and repair protein RecF [Pseudomonas sp. DD1]|uniref:AAA family ATPase n=1 Tax=Pseudomonas sp. DD1 TaxID=879558 RepID=UPI0037CC3882
MRIDYLAVRNFKNLTDISLDFDTTRLETVIIGQNGTGKSNVLEALATIFRDLDDPKRETEFSYIVVYQCKKHVVRIDHRHSDSEKIEVTIDGSPSTINVIRRKDSEYLPNHVFGYYSGESNRFRDIFDLPQRRYYDAAIEAGAEEHIDPLKSEIRRLFYVRERYGALALLTYFAFAKTDAQEFLRQHLGVDRFDSALLTLRQTTWGKRKPTGEMLEKSDPRFWHARGIVRKLLDGLWKQSLAPIRHKATVRENYRSQGSSEEQLFIYLKDEASLISLAEPFGDEQSFFAYLETLDLSDLIRDIRIWVEREGATTAVPFHEISDGEKQLLSVLGMMRFAAHHESLFLLDEPDTHLNPAWKWNYLSFIKQVAGKNENCHVIMTSHDPLTIAGLEKSQVQILYRDQNGTVSSGQPQVDPKGLGVAGVLRQIFGMPTTLDPETQELVDERNTLLSAQGRSSDDEIRLHELNNQLDAFGLSYQSTDPSYDDYLRQLHRTDRKKDRIYTPEEIEAQNLFMQRIVESIR